MSLFDLRDRLRTDLAATPQFSDATAKRGEPALPADLDDAQQPEAEASGKARHYGETLRDLLDAGLLTAGETLLPPPRGMSRSANVTESGTIRVDDVEYATPSGAAKASSGNSAEPGWEFWSVDRGGVRTTLFDLRSRLRLSRTADPT